jgi:hypothetical protein
LLRESHVPPGYAWHVAGEHDGEREAFGPDPEARARGGTAEEGPPRGAAIQRERDRGHQERRLHARSGEDDHAAIESRDEHDDRGEQRRAQTT